MSCSPRLATARYGGNKQKDPQTVSPSSRKNTLPELAGCAFGQTGFLRTSSANTAATVGDVRVIDLYVVNGRAVDSGQVQYKAALAGRRERPLAEERASTKLVVVGDFNIAPTDADVHDPAAWAGRCSAPIRSEPFNHWLSLGLVDCFRKFEHPPKTFTRWDYRMLAFPKNNGLRIDHILAAPALADTCTAA